VRRGARSGTRLGVGLEGEQLLNGLEAVEVFIEVDRINARKLGFDGPVPPARHLPSSRESLYSDRNSDGEAKGTIPAVSDTGPAR
jgi:hypothetical protein